MKEPPRVTVVSASEVDNEAAVTAPVALACTSVPDGLPALSVSIRILRFCVGEAYFLNDNFRVDALTPVPNTGKETLLLPVTFDIACIDVACAKVATVSANTAFQAVRSSPATKVVSRSQKGLTLTLVI